MRGFFCAKTLQEDINQITCLIETMDKLTKAGENRIAAETLKACSGTFSVVLKSFCTSYNIGNVFKKKGLTPVNRIVSCSDCGIVYKATEILCLALTNGCRESSSRCGNKKLAVTDDINQCE